MSKILFVCVVLICTYSIAAKTVEAEHKSTSIDDACDKKAAKYGFSLIDYFVVAAMLMISCVIGTFYGFFGEKQETSNDFLLGGSKMGTLPMSLSLAAR